MNKYSKDPFVLSLAIHSLVFLVLIISSFFNSPQLIKVSGGGATDQPVKPIIQAGLVNNDAVKSAVARQEQQERERQKQLALQRANADKLKKEAEKIKAEADRIKQEAAAVKQKAEVEKQLALANKAEAQKKQQAALAAIAAAEKAKLQAVQEHEKVRIAKEQAAKKLAQAKQASADAAKESAKAEQVKAMAAKESALKEQARVKAAAAKQAQAQAAAKAQALAAAQQAERMSWLDSEFTRFVGELQQRVYNHRTLSSAFGPELVCKIQIKLLPEGSVHDVKVIQSSGNSAYDSMAEAAVYKASPFDMPTDKELVSKLRDIILEFTNENNG